ncbi:MAG: acetyl-CoA carboxylase carboxyltransferase subunit alpha [Phycisphaeraceae bacterium]
MANGTIYSGTYQLDFEKPLIELEKQIGELEKNSEKAGAGYADEVDKLRQSHQSLLKKTYAKLNAWQTVQVARHPGRPQAIDYIRGFVKDFCELHGDRRYGDDPAIITGFGRIGPHKCLIVAHNKGRDTKEKIACHFGCAHPEGYRKALAKMKLAEKYELPIVTFIDTPGAYPGIGAEERGQAEAIAMNLREMSRLKTPIACVVIGEGGSGGALGIGIGDRIAMMQYAWYSVISPEGCAAILWKTGAEAAASAEQLHLTAKDNLKLGVVDEVIEEPMGGAHRAPADATVSVEEWIIKNLRDLKRYKIENLLKRRYEKFRGIGETAKG